MTRSSVRGSTAIPDVVLDGFMDGSVPVYMVEFVFLYTQRWSVAEAVGGSGGGW